MANPMAMSLARHTADRQDAILKEMKAQKAYSVKTQRGDSADGRTKRGQRCSPQGPYNGTDNDKHRRKLRKNEREKQRRSELNSKFDRLSGLLGRNSKAEKFTILQEAIRLIGSLRQENAELKQEKTDTGAGDGQPRLNAFHSVFPDQPDHFGDKTDHDDEDNDDDDDSDDEVSMPSQFTRKPPTLPGSPAAAPIGATRVTARAPTALGGTSAVSATGGKLVPGWVASTSLPNPRPVTGQHAFRIPMLPANSSTSAFSATPAPGPGAHSRTGSRLHSKRSSLTSFPSTPTNSLHTSTAARLAMTMSQGWANETNQPAGTPALRRTISPSVFGMPRIDPSLSPRGSISPPFGRSPPRPTGMLSPGVRSPRLPLSPAVQQRQLQGPHAATQLPFSNRYQTNTPTTASTSTTPYGMMPHPAQPPRGMVGGQLMDQRDELNLVRLRQQTVSPSLFLNIAD